ncbi:MAG: zeta toxin family protein [Gemmatimonadetes bacterium]|nr:zeta toxin family protein [Gemmatimonadota bacterium]
MLILLGGAPRAGKGMISRELVQKRGIALLSLDVLKMGLHRAVPSMGVDPNAHSREVGENMWPLVRAMAENALEADVDYVFEGDMVLPKQAAELRGLSGADVRSCFVGYRDIEPQRKLSDIRRHRGHANDWLNEQSDEEILAVVQFGIEYSAYLSEECDRLGLTYVDGSTDFEGTVDAAVTHLMW